MAPPPSSSPTSSARPTSARSGPCRHVAFSTSAPVAACDGPMVSPPGTFCSAIAASLVKDTNSRLRRLEAGCQVVVQNLIDTGASSDGRDHVDAAIRRLLLGNDAGGLALPSEVGAGIAQVLPVIVAALADRVPFVMIEQPEIHGHPRLQTGLGDLFIEASASRREPHQPTAST